MQISTTARHCELDPALRAQAIERLERCTRFATDLHDVRLIVTQEKFRHTAEIVLRLNHHEMLSKEEAVDMGAAITLAIDSLEAQLRRFKDRRTDHQRDARNGTAAAGGGDSDEEFED